MDQEQKAEQLERIARCCVQCQYEPCRVCGGCACDETYCRCSGENGTGPFLRLEEIRP